MRGKLIVMEGLDGSGITTQAVLLRNYLESSGSTAVLTKEPTDGLIGGLIKSCLRKEWKTSPLTLQLLFTADRTHHLTTEMEPALKKGHNVVSDRYVLSSLAFGALDLPQSLLKQLNSDFRKPHVTFIIDTQPALCLERIKKSRHHIELYEEEQKFQVIRKHYLALKSYFPETYVIDGNKSPEEVHAAIRKVLERL